MELRINLVSYFKFLSYCKISKNSGAEAVKQLTMKNREAVRWRRGETKTYCMRTPETNRKFLAHRFFNI